MKLMTLSKKRDQMSLIGLIEHQEAEYRLCYGHDNADFRLTEIGYQLGLASKERLRWPFLKKEKSRTKS